MGFISNTSCYAGGKVKLISDSLTNVKSAPKGRKSVKEGYTLSGLFSFFCDETASQGTKQLCIFTS